ncbi:MAG: hypothetical protein IKD58_12025 [Loktanella sp.]|nr:hypothetical protein [Loktanella sp.]
MARPPVLDRLLTMSVKQRRDLSLRASKRTQAVDGDADEAQKILDGIASLEFEMFRDRRITVGLIDWEPFEYQHLIRGFYNDKEVASIEYTDTHGVSRKEVFRLSVLGQIHDDLIHHVADARFLGSDIFFDRIHQD